MEQPSNNIPTLGNISVFANFRCTIQHFHVTYDPAYRTISILVDWWDDAK